MTPWTTPQMVPSSPRSARKHRSEEIIKDLPKPNDVNRGSAVPNWLVDEDATNRSSRFLSSSRPPQPASSSSTTPLTSSRLTGGFSKKSVGNVRANSGGTNPEASRDDDFIMVDMLDGDHLPTRHNTGRPIPSLTSNLDSIISLPPVATSVPDSWFALKRPEAQVLHAGLHRATASVGDSHDYARLRRHRNINNNSPLPQGTFKKFEAIDENDGEEFPIYVPTDSNSSAVSNEPDSNNHSTQHQPITVAQLAAATRSRSKHTRTKSTSLPIDLSYLPAASSRQLQQHSRKPPTPTHSRSNSNNRYRDSNQGGGLDSRIPLEPDVITPLRSTSYQQQLAEKKNHIRAGSFNWYDEETDSYAPTSVPPSVYAKTYSHQSVRDRHGEQIKKRGRRHEFQPNHWGWRKPAEEDAIMPNQAWIYLCLIGAVTFATAFLVNIFSDGLSSYIFNPISIFFTNTYGENIGILTLSVLRGCSLCISFIIVLELSPHYGAGSGIPEMKCVLGGVLMPQMLNWKTLVGKMTGLIFSLASDISIGRLGPFIHMSGISAALISKLSIFPSLRTNARFQLQALSAAMAAGVGATFGAPLGGTMLAIELMSSYYYIHWMPMALYCSIMGYYLLISVSKDSFSYFTAENVDLQPATSFHDLFSFVVLGAFCGAIGATLVHFSKAMFELRRTFFKTAFPVRTIIMLMTFGLIHSLITCKMGGVISLSQRAGVDELFINPTTSPQFWLPGAFNIFESDRINSGIALIVVMFVRFILTGISLVMPIPAGVFMPIFQIGALFGRAYGEIWGAVPFFNWLDPKGTAIVGAAAMTAGSLHIVSIAVVMLELTREAIDVLPLAVGVIISYGVSKRLCSDLFSELIRIRKLPFILGLRERYPWETKQFYEDVSNEKAGSLMSKDFNFITPLSTRSEIWDMLSTKGGKPWVSCAFLSDLESRRLWGTVSQQTLWDIVMEDANISGSSKPMSRTSSVRDLNNEEVIQPEYGTFNASERGTLRGMQTISFLSEFNPQIGHPLIDMGPMQTSIQTPCWKIIILFKMISMAQVYVLDDGVTVGCISKADIINHSIRLEERSQRKRKRRQAHAAIQQEQQNRRRNNNNHNLDLPEAFRQVRRGAVTVGGSRGLRGMAGSSNEQRLRR